MFLSKTYHIDEFLNKLIDYMYTYILVVDFFYGGREMLNLETNHTSKFHRHTF